MRSLVLVSLLLGSMLGVCSVLIRSLGADPMLPGEIAVAAMLVTWSTVLARELWSGHRLGRELSRFSTPAQLFGVRYSIVDGGTLACVVGGFRPRTYIGSGLLVRLSPDELQAVLLHEEYHRRTRAPLRAAALTAWTRFLPRSVQARRLLRAREIDLECRADRYAMDHGASEVSIARALLKVEATGFGSGFADHGAARVHALVGMEQHGGFIQARRPMPYEWLPIVLVGVVWLGCRLA